MSAGPATAGVVEDRSSGTLLQPRLARLLVSTASPLRVAAWACLPALAGALLLVLPGRLFSREMTWDLLYNLEGAWHLWHGHVPHVDFHTPLGVLAFAFTQIGFWFTGATPLAALAGPLLLAGPALVAAAWVSGRRLPLLPAVLFTLQVTLLVLLPANVGDPPNAYSLAMSYNRWGWSALTILCLMVFVPPRAGAARPWGDPLLGAVLLFFLFFLKITYAVGGGAAVVAGLALMPHVRTHWRAWTGVVVALTLDAVLPHNRAYLADIWAAATGGSARVDLASLVLSFVADREQFALSAAVVCSLFWLWQRRRTEGAAVIAAAVIVAIGALVRSQNAQVGDMPVALVACFLLYQALWRDDRGMSSAPGQASSLLLAVLAWPLLTVTAEAATLTAYFRAATRDDRVVAGEATNLRGLAVPADAGDLELALADSEYRVLSPLRDPPLRDPLSQHQYVRSLVAAAGLLADAGAPTRVLVLDQVNALPFVLGYTPPRNSWLWLLPEHPPRPADMVFGDVDVVLVPKYSTLARTTVFALETYGPYLASVFPVRQETESWVVLRRKEAAPPPRAIAGQ